MSEQITVRLSVEALAALDAAVRARRFANRAAALREGLDRLLREEREREIEDAYRRGYGAAPQEEWVGETGLAAFGAFVAAEEAGEPPL
jgi:Arc/MetJ-type ribon-helix-helix transcriptional regulator